MASLLAAAAPCPLAGFAGHRTLAPTTKLPAAGAPRACAVPPAPFVRSNAPGPAAQRRAARLETRATVAGRPSSGALTSERSELVNREVVLFLFQRDMDSQLQRALTYEDFDKAKDIRGQRDDVDRAMRELQGAKGYGCGARRASSASQIEFAPRALNLRAAMAEAVAAERYADAAAMRDELAELEQRAAEAELPCPVAEPRFALGQMVVHAGKGYRGVVAGWDLACCESAGWRAAAGVDALLHGPDQVFYHVLVDSADWPSTEDAPPVAYVAEELLAEASMADFASAEPLVDSSFTHPYSYLMFLGADGHGNMIPCAQLRDKYCVQRRDIYPPGQEPEGWYDDEEEEDGGDGPVAGGNGGGGGRDESSSDVGGGAWGGGARIPGIDMSSLD